MFAKWISSKIDVAEEEREVVAYGLEMIVSFFGSTFSVLFIGWVFHRLIASVLFLLIFILLRRVTGGYHAATHLSCYLCMTAIFFAVLCFSSIVCSIPLGLYAILGVGGSWIILWKAPVESQYKPLTKRRRKIFKCLALLLFLGLLLLGICLEKRTEYLGKMVFFSLLAVLLLIVIPAKQHMVKEQNNTYPDNEG